MKVLSQMQLEHFNRLENILNANRVAYDVSATGAGKTVVSLKLARKNNLRAVVIAPPTLRNNWIQEAASEEVEVVFVSNCALKTLPKNKTPSLLIVDEGHAFKNSTTQRTGQLMRDMHDSTFKWILFLSATPYDHPRQESLFKSLVGKQEFQTVISSIQFTHRTRVKNALLHVEQTDEEAKLYGDGVSSIFRSTVSFDMDRGVQHDFNAALFNSGLKKIHDSLISALFRNIERFQGKYKLIICLKFKEHFDQISARFPKCIVLNGSTKMQDRAALVQKFQEPSWSTSMILISASVGGVGIDLDDQYGSFPRKIISLPLFISEYIQLVGRVQRRNTLSNASVLVLQPKRGNTYFKRQLKYKGKVLENFQLKIEFKNHWEHAPTCKSFLSNLYFTKMFGSDVANLISCLSCECGLF